METEFDSAEIIERGENGKEEAVLIRRTQGTPYSCNRRYDLDDLKDGHGFPASFGAARTFLQNGVEFDALNSYDITVMLEPHFRKHGMRGTYHRMKKIAGESQKWRLVNTADFRKTLIDDWKLGDFFGT